MKLPFKLKFLSSLGLAESQQSILLITFGASFVVMILIIVMTIMIQPRSSATVESDSIPVENIQPHSNLEIPGLPAKKESGITATVTELDIHANMFTGQRYLDGNDYENALPYIERVVFLKSSDLHARSLLAEVYLFSGRYEKAERTYDALLSAALPDSLAGITCARKAICAFYEGRRDESFSALTECIEKYPQNAEAYCFLGQIQAMQEMPSTKALSNLNKAIELDSSYVEAWYQLARYYMELKEYIKAREYLLIALDINPLHGKSQSRLGMVYYYLDNFELAEKSYQTALALNPSDFNTRYNLGELYYTENDSAKAIREFKKTLLYNPGHVDANFKLGLLLLANGMTKEAINHFEQASHNEPRNSRILIQLGVAYEKLGNREKALSIYQSILDFDELNAIALQKVKLLKN
jgi:tetratricopeptide (TPR) repeat protein